VVGLLSVIATVFIKEVPLRTTNRTTPAPADGQSKDGQSRDEKIRDEKIRDDATV
jgi:hypothetical protein